MGCGGSTSRVVSPEMRPVEEERGQGFQNLDNESDQNHGETMCQDELQTSSTTVVLDISNTNSNNNDSINTEVAAATKIQARYRGYTTRKRLKSEDSSITNTTTVVLVSNTNSNNNENNNTEVAAATKIQARYRGYVTRKTLKAESDRITNDTEVAAATKIQARYRGYVTRKTLKADSTGTVEKSAEEQKDDKESVKQDIDEVFQESTASR